MSAQPYSAEATTADGIGVVRLSDQAAGAVVSIVPSVGNNSYEMLVNGKNVFYFPYSSLAEFAAKPRLSANPFLAPWANRIDENAFYFNGKKYQLNPELGNVRTDRNGLPIHGLLQFASEWEVTSVEADADGARVTSRLDYSRYADLMAQFPFAHMIEMTYVLSKGVLEVRTRIENTGAQAMPLLIGFHPYFQLHAAPRDQWRVRIAARKIFTLNDKLTPTGETAPIPEEFSPADNLPLAGISVDNVFDDLVRGSDGLARFSVSGGAEKIEVIFGPGYKTAIVYAPQGREFICFEPMTGPTNAFNLAHRGLYADLETVEPGGERRLSYWIKPTGF